MVRPPRLMRGVRRNLGSIGRYAKRGHDLSRQVEYQRKWQKFTLVGIFAFFACAVMFIVLC